MNFQSGVHQLLETATKQPTNGFISWRRKHASISVKTQASLLIHVHVIACMMVASNNVLRNASIRREKMSRIVDFTISFENCSSFQFVTLLPINSAEQISTRASEHLFRN